MALVVRDKWEMMGECLTSMPNISTSTYQMRCTVVRPDGSSVTDVFTVGLVQGTLMIYDQKGMSRTWSDAREELSDIEFLDPTLNARLQDLEKQPMTTAAQQQPIDALSLEARIHASAARERQSAAGMHAAATSAAFNTGEDSGLDNTGPELNRAH